MRMGGVTGRPLAGRLFAPLLLASGSLAIWATVALADGWDSSSQAGNIAAGVGTGGITNTRHNLTISYNSNAAIMDQFRNNYGEICVYCHTPHGANKTVDAPIWNRTSMQRQYELYSKPTVLGQRVTTPGPNSLTCLSCHDGFTAIDSIINMPTRKTGAYAGFSEAQESGVTRTFLSAWDGGARGAHVGLASNQDAESSAANNGPCLTCHNSARMGVPDFQVFVIGQQNLTDFQTPGGDTRGGATRGGRLADDHPVGVKYPDDFGPKVDYREPTIKKGRIAFFDNNGNAHADPNEIRLYDTGDGYEVECGSCHDPHGVRVSEASNHFIPSFLRVGSENGSLTVAPTSPSSDPLPVVANAGSELCLTCHVK